MKSRSVLGCLCCLMAIMTLALFASTSHAHTNQLNSQSLYASNLNVDDSPVGLSENLDATSVAPSDGCACLITHVCTCVANSECTCTCSKKVAVSKQLLLICATHKVRHSVHVHRGARGVRYGHSYQRSRCRGGICT